MNALKRSLKFSWILSENLDQISLGSGEKKITGTRDIFSFRLTDSSL